MGAYYFLVSQLPYLIFGQQPPMSSEAFKDLAKPLLSAGDAAFLDLVSLDPLPCDEEAPSCGCAFIDSWREWDRTMRLNLAKQRAAKIGRENANVADAPFLPVEAVAAAAKAVASSESPLDGEMLIDRARWNAVEAFQGIDYFGINSILAYQLKLLLLERRELFQEETGFAEYKSIYSSIVESISPAGETK